MNARLTYYIYEGVLVGFVDGGFVHISALSGGGGGSKTHRPTGATNNPYDIPLKTVGSHGKGHIHGGPIPPGQYEIQSPAQHASLGLASRLIPKGHFPLYGRGGFFIHGRGPHGSDGCIVPLAKGDFDNLMSGLARSAGGELSVRESMGVGIA